jgi:hypothetical protein
MEKQIKSDLKAESLKDASKLIKIMSGPKHKSNTDAKALMYQRAAEVSNNRTKSKKV